MERVTVNSFENNIDEINGLSIIHINRSLCTHFTQLKVLLENLEFSFDIIALTDTWIDENEAHVFSLDKHDFCHINSKNIIDGGVALFTKNSIHFCIADTLAVDGKNSFECVTVKLLLKQNITEATFIGNQIVEYYIMQTQVIIYLKCENVFYTCVEILTLACWIIVYMTIFIILLTIFFLCHCFP